MDSFIGKDPDFPGLFSKRIWVNSSDTMSPRIRVQTKAGRVDVGVQMRRAVHAYKCCPRHNEPFGVLLASPCTLWQPVHAGRDATADAACFGRSAAVAYVRTMVKQGGSETAENDGSKLVNMGHPRCQPSLPCRCCYPACRRHHSDLPDDGNMSVFNREH